ncbi:hypothetical protein K505DRAFT_358406 [Melanomma pulvis-pyrius CBS 109.77]|uniref:Uncharacterized protein n=1 Tax=Melanomma pulvis-pyrius CBS 109.77 TaxID=1314802 RepID=A0A6A6XLR2_9PLEO|nr:hypothetical protein K505DRAFT_358406 [Melanomma pulvis-pyrius CBS 109.77]
MYPDSSYSASDLPDYVDPPNGSEYQDIKFWAILDPTWLFVPMKRSELCTREKLIELPSADELQEGNEATGDNTGDNTPDNTHGSNIKQSTAFAHDANAGPAIHDADPVSLGALASSKEHDKLLYFNDDPYDPSIMGTGFVINCTSGSTKIIGCYKTFAASDPLRAKFYRDEISKLILDDVERQMEIDRTTEVCRATGLVTRAQFRQCHGMERQMSNNDVKVRRLHGLQLDERPHAIAFHRPPIFEVSPLMTGEELQKFGKTYGQMMLEFAAMMGQEFDREEDVPMFVERWG